MLKARTVSAALTSALVVVLVGCAAGGSGAAERLTAPPAAPAPGTPTAAAVADPAPAAPATPVAPAAPVAPSPEPSPSETARTRAAVVAIPAIGVEDLRVVPYEGTTDDWPGTRIQNRGAAASPYGPDGGVGPGEIGNYLVTAHRLSAGGPLRDLPALDEGDSVLVTSGGTVHEYRITETRKTSFRSERSLAEQRAAVPGKPGERPTKAMITVSTCATPEDDAAGNFWRDAKGNPEHRIDKVGVLVSSKKAQGQ
ncbi:class E sortase [Streptomyces sp. CB03238]|uniref:class E sortase n=1 Tax=Streptomyces sp. CB03238 TaxID=1907777 RepID=UPI000A115902|nr:class E sortase [Streptomyces sp. CB03238]ORT60625.1 sortase [Streptomyces sp. CB03238]